MNIDGHPRRPLHRLSVLLLASLLVLGCDDGEEEESRFLTIEDLAGTWLLEGDWGTDTLEFGENLTVLRFLDTDGILQRREGNWSLGDDGRLTTTYTRTMTSDGVVEVRTETTTNYPAIIDDQLYLGVLFRTEGEGESADGTWRSSDETYEDVVEEPPGPPPVDFYEQEVEAELTVTGSEFNYREDETSADEEGNFYDSVRGGGTLRVDGEQLFWTFTRQDGEDLPEDRIEEEFLGRRLGEHVIYFTSSPTDDPLENSYQRQR